MIILEAPNVHFANVILLLLMLLRENQPQIRATIQPNVLQIIAAAMENVANRQQDYIFCLIHKNINAVAVLLYHLDHANFVTAYDMRHISVGKGISPVPIILIF